MKKIYSLKELAELKGVTTRTIQGWSKNPHLHSVWRIAQGQFVCENPLAHPSKIEPQKEIISFNEWRAKKMKEDAIIAQREREVMEGDLCNRDQVILQIGQAFHTAKIKLLTIPTAIAGSVAIEENASICKEIIEKSIRETLEELSGSIDFSGSSENINDAAAKINS